MNNKEQDNYSNATLDLIKKFVDSNQRKRINLLTQIESEVENIFNLGPSLFDIYIYQVMIIILSSLFLFSRQ